MLAFEVADGKVAEITIVNNLQLIDIANNCGDSKSLACHLHTTTHYNLSPEDPASLGISGAHIRLLVGLEDANDLIKDLEQALACIGARLSNQLTCQSIAQKILTRQN